MGKTLSLPLAHWPKTLQRNRTQSTLCGTGREFEKLIFVKESRSCYERSLYYTGPRYYLESFLTFPFLLPHLFFLTVDHPEDLLHRHLLLLTPLHVHLPPLPRLPLHLSHHHPLLCCVLYNVRFESDQLKEVTSINISVLKFSPPTFTSPSTFPAPSSESPGP